MVALHCVGHRLATRYADHRSRLDPLSRDAVTSVEPVPAPIESVDAEAALLTALRDAPDHGCSIKELMTASGMGRTWVYARLQELAADGRAAQVARGHWTAGTPR